MGYFFDEKKNYSCVKRMSLLNIWHIVKRYIKKKPYYCIMQWTTLR